MRAAPVPRELLVAARHRHLQADARQERQAGSLRDDVMFDHDIAAAVDCVCVVTFESRRLWRFGSGPVSFLREERRLKFRADLVRRSFLEEVEDGEWKFRQPAFLGKVPDQSLELGAFDCARQAVPRDADALAEGFQHGFVHRPPEELREH